jgi:microcystin-dependent protein
MPGSTTTLGLPYPLLGDAADIEQAVRPLADAIDPLIPTTQQKAALQGTLGALSDTNRFVTDQDLIARLNDAMPIATIVPYAGSTLPPLIGGVQRWAWADGSLINRQVAGVDSVFFTRVGHAYNGGVDPGGTPLKVRVPDKRGRSSVGATNYGQGAAANTNAFIQAARGANGGEVQHTLVQAELAQHAHGYTEPNGGAGHAHNINDQGHFHGYNDRNQWEDRDQAGLTQTGATSAAAIRHVHGAQFIATDTRGTGIGIYNATTGIAISNAGSNTPHNNLHPYEADFYIVRIA